MIGVVVVVIFAGLFLLGTWSFYCDGSYRARRATPPDLSNFSAEPTRGPTGR